MGFNWTGAAAGGGAGFALGGPVGAGIGAGLGGFGGGGFGLPDPLGDAFSLKNSISTPTKADFQYKGMAEPGFQKMGQQLYNKPAVQADLTQANQSRALGMQSREGIASQMQKLGELANNDQASAAYRQMLAGGDQNMRQALALSRSTGGGGGAQASALRQASMQNNVANQQLNQQAGIMRAQETAQANAQIGQMAMQQRAMDLQAQGLDAQTAFQQAQLELGSQQLGQQGLLGMYGLGQQASALEQKGLSDYWKTLLGAQAAAMQAEAQQKAGIMGGAAALGAGFLAASDVTAKTNIAPVGTAFGMQGQPQITTGGGTTAPEIPASAMQPSGPTWGQNFMKGYGMANDVFQAFQPKGQVAMTDPANYLPTFGMNDSDARAKTLSDENSALRDALAGMRAALDARQAPRPMMRTGMAGAAPAVHAAAARVPPPAPAVRPMTPQEQQELDWAIQDADAGKFPEMWGTTSGQWSPGMPNSVEIIPPAYAQHAARVAEQKVAMPPTTESDARSKERIAELEGMVTALSGNPGGRYMNADDMAAEDPVAAEVARQTQGGGRYLGNIDQLRPENRPAPARTTTIEPSTIPVTKLDAMNLGRIGPDKVRAPLRYGEQEARRQANVRFDLGSPLEQQAASIPGYTWQYDQQHAVRANAKAGLPPDSPFGFATKTGPMAQQLQRIPALAGTVATGPDGTLQVDGGQAGLTGLSMIGDLSRHTMSLEQRLRALENPNGRPRGPRGSR